jgi:PAS domain S-box-containing protein
MQETNVLIVDDERSMRNLLERLLRKNGYACTLAADSDEALQCLANDSYDVLLLDITMPGESGLDLIPQVKEQCPDIAILMVTATDDPKQAQVTLEMGVYGYIVKPFASNQILISLTNALRRRELERKEKEYHEQLENAVRNRTQNLEETVQQLKKSQQELEASKASLREQLFFLQVLLDAIPSPVFYKDTQGIYLGCNKGFEEFIGLAKDEIVGKTVHGIAPKDLADRYHEADNELLRKPGKQTYESQVTYADGTPHNVIFNKATYTDSHGNLAGLVGVILDVTERKRAERELCESESRFRNLVEGSIQGILIHKDFKPLFVNQACANIYGYTVDEILEMDSLIPLFAQHEQPWIKSYTHRINNGKGNFPTEYECQGVRRDGTTIWLNNKVRSVDWKGEAAIQCTIADVTQAKQDHQILEESEERFRAVSDSAQDAIIIVDPAGQISYWNKAAEKIFGYRQQEVMNHSFGKLLMSKASHDTYAREWPIRDEPQQA